MKQSVTVGAQLLWSGRYGCNNGRYGCTIVMSYIEINKAVSQWLLTLNLCISVTWPLTCAFHIPCTHTPEIIDMHRGVCDKVWERYTKTNAFTLMSLTVRMRSSSGGSLSTGEVWDRHTGSSLARGKPNSLSHDSIPSPRNRLARRCEPRRSYRVGHHNCYPYDYDWQK